MFIIALIISYILLFVLFLSVFRLAKEADRRRGQLWNEHLEAEMQRRRSVTSDGQMRKIA